MAPFTRGKAGGSKGHGQGSPATNNDNAESSGSTTVRSPNLDIKPTNLRSRFSPRLSPDPAQAGIFEAQQNTYPVPSSRSLLSGWGKRGKGKESERPLPQAPATTPHYVKARTPIAAKYATAAAEDTTPRSFEYDDEDDPPHRTTTLAVPRFDARGYPIRSAPELKVHISSPQSSHTSSPQRPPRKSSPLKSRPVSSSSDEGTPRKHRYPPTSYAVDSARSSLHSGDPGTPSRSRRSSDASGSESLYASYARDERGYTPGASLYGDSTHSFETQHTYSSNAPVTQQDAVGKAFTLQMQQSALSVSSSAYAAYTSSSNGHKRKGEPALIAFLDDPDSYNYDGAEDDDFLHDTNDPDLLHGKKQAGLGRSLLTVRGAANVGCMGLLVTILVALFMGYPVATAMAARRAANTHFIGYQLTNASGQVPLVYRQPIDPATPEEAKWKESMETGEKWQLIFSDEFEQDGRTFYPGDDPYWEAHDLHYWPTNNKEWYDPKMVTTRNGNLVVTLTNEPSHGLNYTGGMITSWNQFCFTGGYMEARVSLPGTSDVWGLWPAIWTMGNLGRAGYGGTNDGLWPYSYDSCDVGTLKNQSLNGLPKIPKELGDKYNDFDFNYLPGQRLSACTCPGDPSHPGPVRADGTYVGRSAPEIDIFEAAVDDETGIGHVSLSAQWAPFNPGYTFINTSLDTAAIIDKTHASYNTYQGSVLQQATSVLGETNQNCYTRGTGCFSVYGVEFMPSDYITWRSDDRKAWTLRQAAMAPNKLAQVGQRVISEEPMYMIINLGMSENFGAIDYEGLAKQFPVEMHVDYIRVYQHPDKINVGCDPKDYPTADFIDKYRAAYSNPNITTFQQLQDVYPGLQWPKNRLVDQC